MRGVRAGAFVEPAGDEIADDGARAAALASSLEILSKVETFYDMIGGLIGYQCTAMELCLESMTGEPAQVHSDAQCDGLDCLGVPGEVQLHVPPGVDLRANNGAFAATASRWGLEELPKMAEIYPPAAPAIVSVWWTPKAAKVCPRRSCLTTDVLSSRVWCAI